MLIRNNCDFCRIVALLKSYEFMLFLQTLLEVQSFIINNRYYVPWALAQHYEFAKPMIDITSDISVAALFATHYYDRVSKEYRLVKEGVGRIRFIANMVNPELKGPLQPIGMQPFARPDRQDGYGFWISESEDLDDYSDCVEFVQDYGVNLKLKTAMMGGVNYLFPNEQVSYMAQIIKNTDIVTRSAIEFMLSDIAGGNSYIVPDVTEDDIDRVVKDKNIFVVDAPAICPEALPHMTNAFIDESRLVVRPAYR